jgi:predicted phage replisome organizer
MADKKYYWLKLKDDFFTLKEIKKLRKIAGGDTYTIIYLKLQLLSLKKEGMIVFEGIEDTFVEELALTLDEEPENVKMTLLFLQKVGFIEEVSNDEFLLPQAVQSMGSETSVAERVRKHRENQKLLQSNTQVTICNTEIEIEKDKEIEKDIYKVAGSKNFKPPTLEEVKSYCTERNNKVDANKWYNFYESKGWMIGKNKMKDWKAAVRTWEDNAKNTKVTQKKTFDNFNGRKYETDYGDQFVEKPIPIQDDDIKKALEEMRAATSL